VTDERDHSLFLLFRVQERFCALPIEQVVETMRPLPIEPLSGAPDFVLGVAVVRGAPIPVVGAARLLGADVEARPGRFITVRVGERRVALAVSAVEGVRALPLSSLQALPPVLGDAEAVAVSLLGTLDAGLLLVLNGLRLVPEPLWPVLEVDRAS
jgi:purine-binding chemotaxis protein CheW